MQREFQAAGSGSRGCQNDVTLRVGVRRSPTAQTEDAIEVDRVLTMLMCDEVESRRESIEANALWAANIDCRLTVSVGTECENCVKVAEKLSAQQTES